MPPSALRALSEKKILSVICFGILCVMIVAAFWPFSFHPANHVIWLSGENGLHFNGSGIIWSPREFGFQDPLTPAGVALEIWLEPSQENYGTSLLSFSYPGNPDNFRLRQAYDHLLVSQEPFASARHAGMTSLWLPHPFHARRRSFIAISSGPLGTTVYLDGVPAQKSAIFKIDPKSLSGRLIVGTSPVIYDTWRGKLMGVAVFHREITPALVSDHYQAWLKGEPGAIQRDEPVALYTFAERAGNIVHNQISSGPDLVIPKSYRIPYKPFLKAPWKEFYPNQSYLRDVLINIAGFVPLGFFFCMLFSSSGPGRKAVWATILLGALFSLTIEVLQGFIPVRDSGTTDIITNTLGTVLGVMLYRSGTLEVLLGKLESRASLKANHG